MFHQDRTTLEQVAAATVSQIVGQHGGVGHDDLAAVI
jgi:hypothetical protein